jgi:hypothetical protein
MDTALRKSPCDVPRCCRLDSHAAVCWKRLRISFAKYAADKPVQEIGKGKPMPFLDSEMAVDSF